MKTPVKIALGLAGISPFPFFALVMGLFIYFATADPDNLPLMMEYAVFINLFFLLVSLIFTAVQIIYIVHAAKNPNIEAMRVTWIIFLIVLGPFAMPFYWFHHIWREGRDYGPSGPLGL